MIFNRNAPIKIYTDASAEGMGAILKQTQTDGTDKPVAYFSKKFNMAQKKKKAIYLECIAIKEALKYWQYWLLGNKFTVYTDHKPLENLKIKARTDEELGDLANFLSQFNFEIKYNPGKNNEEADCLSRNPVLGHTYKNENEIIITTNTLTLKEIKEDQSKTENQYKTYTDKEIHYKIGTKRITLSEELGSKLIKKNSCRIWTYRSKTYVNNYTKTLHISTNEQKN